jgi:hypothetical protein
MRTIFWTSLALLLVAGCKKSEGSPSGAASAAPKEPACAAGETADPAKTFCVKIPAGYKMEAPKENPPNIDVWIKQPDDKPPSIRIWHRADETGTDYTAFTGNIETDSKASYTKVESKGKLESGTGEFMIATQEEKTHKIIVAVKGNKRLLVCDASSYETKLPAAVIEACKSVKPFPLQ